LLNYRTKLYTYQGNRRRKELFIQGVDGEVFDQWPGIQAAHAPKLARQRRQLNDAAGPEDMAELSLGNNMRMHNPPHPGETLREDVLPALGLSVAEAARQLGISRVAFSRVLHGHAAISIDLARRLEAWLRKPDGCAQARKAGCAARLPMSFGRQSNRAMHWRWNLPTPYQPSDSLSPRYPVRA